MTQPQIKHIVKKQIPEFIANAAPKFIDFLKAYYDFLESYNVDFRAIKDVDFTPEELLGFLKREFLPQFPSAKINDRRLIPLINSLYKKKGTVDAFKLLYRIFFDTVVDVSFPKENILKASDGVWRQLSFITVSTTFGSLEDESLLGAVVKIENNFGVFLFDLEKIEKINASTYRLYYRSFKNFIVEDGQDIDVIVAGERIYRGLLQKSPSAVVIGAPGKFWKRGQLIRLPGSTKSSLGVVRSIGNNGELKYIDVLEWGYDNNQGDIFILYPFDYVPPTSNFQLETITTSYDPLSGEFTNTYNITITEELEELEELGNAISDAKSPNSYFLEDYVLEFYVGAVVASWISSKSSNPIPFLLDNPFTYEDWLASRTTAAIRFENVSKLPGEYLNDNGQISNVNTRLQDNFFYQLFSYVIKSDVLLTDSRGLINLINPAGLKFFAEYELNTEIERTYEVFRSITKETIFVNDDSIAEEYHAIDMLKETDDLVESTDSFTSSINKLTLETASANDGDATLGNISYAAEDYFSEVYVEVQKLITVG